MEGSASPLATSAKILKTFKPSILDSRQNGCLCLSLIMLVWRIIRTGPFLQNHQHIYTTYSHPKRFRRLGNGPRGSEIDEQLIENINRDMYRQKYNKGTLIRTIRHQQIKKWKNNAQNRAGQPAKGKVKNSISYTYSLLKYVASFNKPFKGLTIKQMINHWHEAKQRVLFGQFFEQGSCSMVEQFEYVWLLIILTNEGDI